MDRGYENSLITIIDDGESFPDNSCNYDVSPPPISKFSRGGMIICPSVMEKLIAGKAVEVEREKIFKERMKRKSEMFRIGRIMGGNTDDWWSDDNDTEMGDLK